jgi:SAM-dependent methyltransferase
LWPLLPALRSAPFDAGAAHPRRDERSVRWPVVEGYDDTTYGRAFADVYDEWYEAISDAEATAGLIADLADGAGATVLELGAGTGRLAVPMRNRGLAVTALDISAEMLDRLTAADPAGAIEVVQGDMVDDLPPGPFAVALVAYNTLFNLDDEDRQQACFHAVARRLAVGGRFVVEAFVPDEPFRSGQDVAIRSMTADSVVLSLAMYAPGEQRAHGQFVELSAAGGVRLRPWAVRYVTVAQLDAMAAAAGLTLEHRWADVHRSTFTAESTAHVSVYRR